MEELTDAIMTKKAFPLDESLKRYMDTMNIYTQCLLFTVFRPAACVLQVCLSRIASTYQLMHYINERAHTKYDSTNPIHEQKLLKVQSIHSLLFYKINVYSSWITTI